MSNVVSQETLIDTAAEAVPVLNEAVSQLLDWARAGASLATEQAPLLAQEICAWGMAEALIFMVSISVPALIASWIGYKLFKSSNEYDEARIAGISLEFIGLTIAALAFAVNGLTIAKISYAPRLYLIEYLSNLLP